MNEQESLLVLHSGVNCWQRVGDDMAYQGLHLGQSHIRQTPTLCTIAPVLKTSHALRMFQGQINFNPHLKLMITNLCSALYHVFGLIGQKHFYRMEWFEYSKCSVSANPNSARLNVLLNMPTTLTVFTFLKGMWPRKFSEVTKNQRNFWQKVAKRAG